MMMLERDGSLVTVARTRTHGSRSFPLQCLARRTRGLVNWRLGWTRSGADV